MAIYLNPGVENLELDRNTPYYVDKSLLISKLNSLINTNSRFVCVSRPRRFGKTMAVNMITAYYSKDCDSHHIFSDLKIANDKSFEDHINKYNVLNIDINGCLCNKNNSLTVVDFINQSVVPEIVKSYPNVKIKAEDNLAIAISKVYEATKEKFIIVLDETLYSAPLKKLLKPDGKILINTKQKIGADGIAFDGSSFADALHLPTVNTVMLGVASVLSEMVTVQDLFHAIDGYMPEKIREKNKQAVEHAAKEVLG